MLKNTKRKSNIITRLLFNQVSLALVGLLVIILVSIPLGRKVSQKYRINKEIKELQNEINVLENKNSSLEKIVNYLESDQFVEEQARLNLGLKKPGEEVVIIKPNNNQNSSAKQQTLNSLYKISGLEKQAPKSSQEGNPKKWFKYFLGK